MIIRNGGVMKHILKVTHIEDKYYFIEEDEQEKLNDRVKEILEDNRDCDGDSNIGADIYNSHDKHELYGHDEEYSHRSTIVAMTPDKLESKKVKDK